MTDVTDVARPYDIVVIGLTITSSWGNGHATTYRGLLRALHQRGRRVLFLEQDKPWYATNRDLLETPDVTLALYGSIAELQNCYAEAVRDAKLVIVGSYVPEGITVGDWALRTARGPVAFYDIDTPVTLAKLANDQAEYISREQVRRYDLYLSFTGGFILDRLEREFGSPCARPLYCSADPQHYYPEARAARWDLGYMGTYSADRQPALETLMLDAARMCPEGRMVVAGPLYPASVQWPLNVERIEHLSPARHREFYTLQRYTLNLTRADMVRAGYSPSVRLFEAAACGTPIISDWWTGLDQFFKIGEEILLSHSADETLRYVKGLSEPERLAIGERARQRVYAAHTAAHRAMELESYVAELAGQFPQHAVTNGDQLVISSSR